MLVSLRPANTVDCLNLARSEAETTPYPWKAGHYHDTLQSGYPILIAEEGKTVIGAAVWMTVVNEADLLNIFITKSYQHQGNGAWLLAQVIDRLRQDGVKRLVLEVRTSNYPARQLYERKGFTRCGLRKNYYPLTKGREDAILMEKML